MRYPDKNDDEPTLVNIQPQTYSYIASTNFEPFAPRPRGCPLRASLGAIINEDFLVFSGVLDRGSFASDGTLTTAHLRDSLKRGVPRGLGRVVMVAPRDKDLV